MKQQKGDLARRHKETHERSSQGKFGTIFLRDKIPEGITFWACSADKHCIDIIPYFAGKNDPNADEGQVQYCLDLYVHRNVGPRDLVYVCPAYTWNDPCPICEDLKSGNHSDDYIDDHKEKHRTIYFVWVHDSAKEEKEGIKIWEIAHWFMQNHLDELAESPRTGGMVLFSDPDEGKMIGFSRKGSGAMNTKFMAHQFIERDEPIPDEILDSTFSLDEVVKMRPTYDEIEAAYQGRRTQADEDSEADETGEERKPKEMEQTEEPQRRRPSPRDEEPADENPCPEGKRFGVDIDTMEACQKCDEWDPCVQEYKRLQKPEPEPPPQEDPPRRRLPRRTAN
jgi:hypothetical protein